MNEQAIKFANWIGHHGYDYLGGGVWESQYTGGEYSTALLYSQFESDERGKEWFKNQSNDQT